MATPIKFRAEVTRVLRHADDVATFEFRYLDRRPRCKPGQFLHLALDPYDPAGHWPESRCFTIARGTRERDSLRLVIALKGRFTTRIFEELREVPECVLPGRCSHAQPILSSTWTTTLSMAAVPSTEARTPSFL